ncbi:MAG: serine/threonine-protein phosphatase [Ruminococcus sp.]|nr:serine/threonine-protein phosphatase [Ruminococcus sp.]
MYYCCGITEKGNTPHNEDAVLVGGTVLTSGTAETELDAPFFAAVSDGVSGENAGELASSMCLERVAKIEDLSPESLRESLFAVHEELAEHSRNDPESRNMQTTLCGVAVNTDGSVAAFNVGDSRLYRFREGDLRQLSRDQSLVQLLIEEGSITQEDRKTHVHRNIIFPAFGNIKDLPKIDIQTIEGGMEYGDVLLICSDGLSDFMSSLEMQYIMELPKSLPKRLEMLVKGALAHQGNDNISVVAVMKI